MMTRPRRAHVLTAALVCLCAAMSACETEPLAAGEPISRIDVHVDRPSGTIARTDTPAPRESVPVPMNIETTDPGTVMGSEPVAARTAPVRPAPQPARASSQPPEQWWLMTPEPVPGRIRIVAKGGGESLPGARQAAVDAGREQLTRLRGSAPDELDFEKTQAFPRAGGVYEAFVLISCER
ncbi:MAG: hypothetical protein DHS20C14_07390 [Phycisphaeraceae bacterium]|nr:MAG: hypothetical protein DHS20C14_07390 [Phycisphaeraceae bacterium]